VQLITPRDNDSQMTENKTRAQYPALKQAGVEVYEWPGMTHMKVAAMDGEWATFGSANLDAFSTDKNDELNVIVMDKGFANEVASRICGADVPRSARK
jgi:cardiolipin synthase